MDITVEGLHFCAAHRLMHHKGKCSHVHGHNFQVRVSFYGTETDDETGMIVDFGDIKEVVSKEVDELDHCSILNVEDKALVEFLRKMESRTIIMGNEPTAEEISKYLFRRIQTIIDNDKKFATKIVLMSVQIWETPKFSATYSLEDEEE